MRASWFWCVVKVCVDSLFLSMFVMGVMLLPIVVVLRISTMLLGHPGQGVFVQYYCVALKVSTFIALWLPSPFSGPYGVGCVWV